MPKTKAATGTNGSASLAKSSSTKGKDPSLSLTTLDGGKKTAALMMDDEDEDEDEEMTGDDLQSENRETGKGYVFVALKQTKKKFFFCIKPKLCTKTHA